MITSSRFRLNLNDAEKAFIVAVVSPIAIIIYNTTQSGSLTFNWHQMLAAGITGAAAFLMHNFLSAPSQPTAKP